MITLLAVLALATPQAAPPSTAAFREAREDIRLPTKRRVRVRQDVFDATVTLRTKAASRIAKQLLKTPSALCPSIDANKRVVVLHCDSRRVVVKVIKRKGKQWLRIERLRGVRPRGPGALPRITYEAGPGWLELNAVCPGKRPIIRAECHFKSGRRIKAARLFKEELHGEHAALAALRLGDISREAGRLNLALGWYRQAGRTGPFARIAMARRCSLTGSCDDISRDARKFSALDPAALPPVMRDEVILTKAQVLLFEDRPKDAALYLLDTGMATPQTNPCRLAEELCAKIAREVLRAGQLDPDPTALAFYYALPNRAGGVDAEEMASLASDAAATFGAPSAAAHLLAAVTGRVKQRRIARHLEKTAALYLDGGDIARARAVIAFADEMDPGSNESRTGLRRRARRQPAFDTVPFTDRVPAPEEVRAHGVLFSADRALEKPVASFPPEPGNEDPKAAKKGTKTTELTGESLRGAALASSSTTGRPDETL